MKDVYKRFHDDGADLFVPYTRKRPRLWWELVSRNHLHLWVDHQRLLRVELEDFYEEARFHAEAVSSQNVIPPLRQQVQRRVDAKGDWLRFLTDQAARSDLLHSGHWRAEFLSPTTRTKFGGPESVLREVPQHRIEFAFCGSAPQQEDWMFWERDLGEVLPLRQRAVALPRLSGHFLKGMESVVHDQKNLHPRVQSRGLSARLV